MCITLALPTNALKISKDLNVASNISANIVGFNINVGRCKCQKWCKDYLDFFHHTDAQTPNSNSKSPFTKLKEMISNCSISFYTYTLIESATLKASKSSQYPRI